MAKLTKEEVQLQVNLKMDDAKKNLTETLTKVEALKKEVADLEATGKKGTEEWTEAFTKLQTATVDASKAQETYTQAGKAFVRVFKTITTEADLAGNSIRGLDRQAKELDLKLKASVVGSEEYDKLLSDLTDVQLKLQQQRKAQQELATARRDAASIAAAAGRIEKASLSELREASIALNRQIEQLTPNTQEWIDATRKLGLVDGQIKKLDASLGKVKQTGSDMKDVLKSALGFTLADTVSNVIQGVTAAAHDGVEQIIAYENSLRDLQAITGVSDAELEKLKQSASELTTIVTDGGNKISNTSTDIFEAFKLVGSAKPELLKNADGLKAVTKEALILAKAGGQELPDAVKSMTSIMNQFNLPATESARIINTISAGAKEGSVEIAQEAEAIEKFGASAKLANVSLEQSVALAQIVGKVIPEASSAGLQLKTVITNIDQPKLFSKEAIAALNQYSVNLELLGDRTVPFSEKLKEMSKIQNDGAAIVRVFGRESQVAATQLLQNVDTFEQMTKAVTGTNEAYTQAAVRSNNLGNDISNLQADVKELFLTLAAGNTGALNDLVRGLDDTIVSIKGLVDPLGAARAEHENLVKSVEKLTTTIDPLLTEYDNLTAKIALNTGAGKDTREEQARVKSIIEQVTAVIPSVVKGFDEYGNALDINTGKARAFILAQQQMSREAKQNRIELNSQRLAEIETRRKELEKLQAEGTREARGLLEQAIAPLVDGGAGQLFGAKRKSDIAASNAQLQELIALQNEEKAIKGELITLTGKETEADMKKRIQQKVFTDDWLAEKKKQLEGINAASDAETNDADVTEKASKKKAGAKATEKKAVDFVAGSIAYLRERVSELNKELENEPPEKQAELAKKLAEATNLLAAAEANLNAIKKQASGRIDTPASITPIPATSVTDTGTKVDDATEIANLSADAEIDATKRGEDAKEVIRKDKATQRQKDEADWLQAALQMTQIAANTIFSIWNQSSERRKTRELNNVALQFNGRLQAAKGNQKAIDAINKEMDEEKERIEKQAFQRKKRMDLAQAIINGALAITGIIASTAFDPTGTLRTIQLAIAGVALAAQLATIAATKFARGGIVQGATHEQGGIKMMDTNTGQVVGEMEGGESYMILSKQTTANNRPLIEALLDSSLNQGGRKILANGGIVYSPISTPVLDISRSSIIPGPTGSSNSFFDTRNLEVKLDQLIRVVINQQNQLQAVITYTDLEQAQRDVERVRRLAK